MRGRLPFAVWGLIGLVVWLSACVASEDVGKDEFNVKVDTESEQAWTQYVRNHAFASAYQPRCTTFEAVKGQEGRPKRVLVTGFGRFQTNRINASGLAVAELLPELAFPQSEAPAPGEVDDPATQTAVAQQRVVLPELGEVDICAMVLPVFWDLSAVLVLRELQAFQPDLVVLNGIASPRQPIGLELGARNRANGSLDGSNLLGTTPGEPLIATAAESEYTRHNRLSWHTVQAAMEQERQAWVAAEPALGNVVPGIELAPVRDSNSYLCNNTTYVLGYAMDHPGQVIDLMEASHPRDGFDARISLALKLDYSQVPRVFIHWPSELAAGYIPQTTALLQRALVAQLTATSEPVSGADLEDDRP